MDNETLDNELIELGIASADTRGGMIGKDDEEAGWRPDGGLTND